MWNVTFFTMSKLSKHFLLFFRLQSPTTILLRSQIWIVNFCSGHIIYRYSFKKFLYFIHPFFVFRHISATRSYHSYDLVADMDFARCKFQDEHSKPMEEDTTLHSIVLMYADLCTIARTTLLHFLDLVARMWRFLNDIRKSVITVFESR